MYIQVINTYLNEAHIHLFTSQSTILRKLRIKAKPLWQPKERSRIRISARFGICIWGLNLVNTGCEKDCDTHATMLTSLGNTKEKWIHRNEINSASISIRKRAIKTVKPPFLNSKWKKFQLCFVQSKNYKTFPPPTISPKVHIEFSESFAFQFCIQ